MQKFNRDNFPPYYNNINPNLNNPNNPLPKTH